MEVVLRPVNDVFLEEVVFPAFELGVVSTGPAVEHLLAQLDDEPTRVLLDLVLEQSSEGTFFGLSDERWTEAVYRMLFHEWVPDRDGWTISDAYTGFAGPWEETFHLALMIEDPDYPYDDHDRADLYRRAFWGQPKKQHGLSTMLCGAWDPFPPFPPDQVLTTEGNGLYDRQRRVARADWSWRHMLTVSQWAAKLPGKMSKLLEREQKRLRPVEAPERLEIVDYWLGRVPDPPVLSVSFSGLGPRTDEWIRGIGALGHMIRNAAASQSGLTAVISRKSEAAERGGIVTDDE